MSIEVQCNCGKTYRLADTSAGKKVRCKACQQVIAVPLAEDDGRGEYDLKDNLPPSLPPTDFEPPADPAPWLRDPSLIGAQNTVASNPGMMKFEILTYLMCLPPEVIQAAVLLVVGTIIWAISNPETLIYWPVALLVAIIYVLMEVVGLKGKFHGGTRNPAIVISEWPYRVAVYADLSTGRSGPKPSIRILGAPLRFARGGPFKVGTRLAAVAQYAGNVNAAHWTHFNPTIVNCGVSSPQTVNRAVYSLPKNEWALLERGLAALPSKKPGMYYLWGNKVTAMTTSPIAYAFVIVVAVAVGVALMSGKNRDNSRTTTDSPTAPSMTAPPVAPVAKPKASRAEPRAVVEKTPPLADHQPEPSKPDMSDAVAEVPAPAEPKKQNPPTAATPPADGPKKSPFSRPQPGTPTPANNSRPPLKEPLQAGDRIEVEWGGSWFPSTVIKRENGRARIHYDGWSDSFDEWVPDSRMRSAKPK